MQTNCTGASEWARLIFGARDVGGSTALRAVTFQCPVPDDADPAAVHGRNGGRNLRRSPEAVFQSEAKVERRSVDFGSIAQQKRREVGCNGPVQAAARESRAHEQETPSGCRECSELRQPPSSIPRTSGCSTTRLVSQRAAANVTPLRLTAPEIGDVSKDQVVCRQGQVCIPSYTS